MQWPGEKLLEKLWDTIADKGIGSLLRPWQMRREGTAAAEIKRLNLLVEAQAEIDAQAIRSGKRVLLRNGILVEASDVEAPACPAEVEVGADLISLDEAVTIAVHNADIEALRREISVSKAVAYAEAELAQDGRDPPAEAIADDWLLRWRENAAAVNSDDLQSLWGKVLAGEVQAPGQFSLRVLDFLRNLSQAEAKELELLSRVTTGEVILRCDAEIAAIGITRGILEAAEELGILNGTGAMGLSWQLGSELSDKYQAVIHTNNRAILIIGSDPVKKAAIPAYPLTRLGRQVLKLAGGHVDESYLRAISAQIKPQGFEVLIGDYAIIGNMYQISNAHPA
jgi:hypothetical protein